MYILDWKSSEIHMSLYVFFISPYLLYTFQVLFTLIIMVKFGLAHQSKLDRAESVRMSQPEPAQIDYPTSHIP
jgi:hypothetical protein